MNRHFKIRLLILFVCAVALAAAYRNSRTETAMVEAANRFIQSLSPEQKTLTVFDFSAKDRLNWHYFPEGGYEEEYGYGRRGISYKLMDAKQQRLAGALLSAGLSQMGFAKAMTVMSLEEILRIIEKDTTGYRDIQKYYFSIFGQPSPTGTWGWRLEGHHLSLHFTIKSGELVSSSPTFFGANPHTVREGPHEGLRTLAREEDLARALVKALDAKQRREAILYDVAYEDILTLADQRAKLESEPPGLPVSKMNRKQVEMLTALVEEYGGNMPPDVAARRLKAFQDTPRERIFFAWAGSIEPGKGDYYRVQAPTFLIEYDNTQNGNNHSHSVWRDFNGDFGLDVLALHHRRYDHGLTRIHAAD